MFDIKDNSSTYFVFLLKSQLIMDRMSHGHLLLLFAVFFHSFASHCLLILLFWKNLHALIMLQTNLHRSESLGLLVKSPVSCRDQHFTSERTHFFSIYINSTLLQHKHREEPHAHTCTNRLLPDEHCVLRALPCSLKIQQQGKEENKCDPHSYSFF